MLGLTLKDLNLKKDKSFNIEYNFNNFYIFDLVVDDFIKEDADNESIDFKVLSGKGYGVIDNRMCGYLEALLTLVQKRDDYDSYCRKSDR